MTQVKENMDDKLDLIWQQHKDRVQKTDIGTFVDVDNITIRDAGVSQGDMMSPGGLTTWKNDTSGSRYFLDSFGPGRTRLFRR